MSARKLFLPVLLFFTTLAVAAVLTVIPRHNATSPSLPKMTYHLALPRPDGQHAAYDAWVAHTADEHAVGLGNLASMPANRAMVFEYPVVQRQCFWMKDMRFPLDMVWLDSAKAVAALERDVQPDSYPQAYCHDGQYIVELHAGEAARSGLKPGQKISF